MVVMVVILDGRQRAYSFVMAMNKKPQARALQEEREGDDSGEQDKVEANRFSVSSAVNDIDGCG